MSPTLLAIPVRRAIYGKLAGDTTLNNLLGTPAPNHNKAIYHELAPDLNNEDARFPYVIFQKMSGVPVYAMVNGGSAYDEDIWMVKAVDKDTSADGADAVAQRLDALLTDGSLNISGGTLMYLRRESVQNYSELDSGVVFKHSAVLFRVIYA